VTELDISELGSRLLREALITGPAAWSSRADIMDAVIEWAEFEELPAPTAPRIYRALRAAGVAEVKRMGVRGFNVAVRDADWTPEAQVDRFLRRADFVNAVNGDWVPMTQLYGVYRIWAHTVHEEPMSSRRFAGLMASNGYRRARRTDSKSKPVQRRTPSGYALVRPAVWGWDGISIPR
jgi:hypothetical protein